MLQRVVLALCVLVVLAVPVAAFRDTPHQPVLEFGVIQADGFHPVREISNRPGVHYGWHARVGGATPLRWKEVFTLPAAPQVWGAGQVSADRHTAVTEGLDTPGPDGYLEVAQWQVVQGDPNGTYEMTVYIDGHRVGSVSFDVH